MARPMSVREPTMALLLTFYVSLLAAPGEFECAAWVDHFDFTGPREGDRYLFDTETPEGWSRILDHVEEVGATSILWRNVGGGNLRYASDRDGGHHAGWWDKRRGPDNAFPGGWVRYSEAQPDIIASVMTMCRERGLLPGVHWPFEENHWSLWTVGQWNLEHPQYWCRTRDGRPWHGRASLAYPAVFAHKLALLDELVERGATAVFIDFFRTGGWTPSDEYVPPVMAAWRERYGGEPPAETTDPQWCRHVADYVTAFIRAASGRLRAADPPVRLYIGIPDISVADDRSIIRHGADWRRWVDEGLVDTLVINYLAWDAARPWDSTREQLMAVQAAVAGRCRVLHPVRAYDFSGYGMPSYMKATGLNQAEVAVKLIDLASETGADGISLECVDYRNYQDATRLAMRTRLADLAKR